LSIAPWRTSSRRRPRCAGSSVSPAGDRRAHRYPRSDRTGCGQVLTRPTSTTTPTATTTRITNGLFVVLDQRPSTTARDSENTPAGCGPAVRGTTTCGDDGPISSSSARTPTELQRRPQALDSGAFSVGQTVQCSSARNPWSRVPVTRFKRPRTGGPTYLPPAPR